MIVTCPKCGGHDLIHGSYAGSRQEQLFCKGCKTYYFKNQGELDWVLATKKEQLSWGQP